MDILDLEDSMMVGTLIDKLIMQENAQYSCTHEPRLQNKFMLSNVELLLEIAASTTLLFTKSTPYIQDVIYLAPIFNPHY